MLKITFSVASIITLYYIYNCYFSSSESHNQFLDEEISSNKESDNVRNDIKNDIINDIINDKETLKKNMQLVVYKPKHLIPYKNYNDWEII